MRIVTGSAASGAFWAAWAASWRGRPRRRWWWRRPSWPRRPRRPWPPWPLPTPPHLSGSLPRLPSSLSSSNQTGNIWGKRRLISRCKNPFFCSEWPIQFFGTRTKKGLLILLNWHLPSSKTSHHRSKEPGVEGHGDEHEEVGEGEGDQVEEGLEGVRPWKEVRPQHSDAASRGRVGRRRDHGGFVTFPLRRLGRHGHVVVRNRTRQALS